MEVSWKVLGEVARSPRRRFQEGAEVSHCGMEFDEVAEAAQEGVQSALGLGGLDAHVEAVELEGGGGENKGGKRELLTSSC